MPAESAEVYAIAKTALGTFSWREAPSRCCFASDRMLARLFPSSRWRPLAPVLFSLAPGLWFPLQLSSLHALPSPPCCDLLLPAWMLSACRRSAVLLHDNGIFFSIDASASPLLSCSPSKTTNSAPVCLQPLSAAAAASIPPEHVPFLLSTARRYLRGMVIPSL